MAARLVRHSELIPAPPAARCCGICRGPERREDTAPCEHCGGLLHWPCYWPSALTQAERDALAAALQADAHAPKKPVGVRAGGRRFAFDVIVGRRAAADYLDRQIVLCPGCRS